MFFQRKSGQARRALRAQRRRHEFRVTLARQGLKPQFETLESRCLLATVNWIAAGGGSWNDGFNWDSGTVPGPADDAIIPDLVGSPTITINATGADVRSITSQERVAMFGAGGIRVTQASSFAAGLDITGGSGTLRGGGTITIGGASVWSGATPSIGSTTVSILGALTIDTTGGSLIVDGTLNVAASGGVEVIGSNPIVLNGTLSTDNGGVFSLAGSAGIANPSFTGGIQNEGRFERTVLASSVNVSASLNNLGEVRVSGGRVEFTGTVSQVNTVSETLTGGVWHATQGGEIAFPVFQTVRNLGPEASIYLNFPGSRFPNFTGESIEGALSVVNGATLVGGTTAMSVASTGAVEIGNGSSISGFPSFFNSGTVIVSGEIPISNYTQTNGLTLLNEGTIAQATILGGTLGGEGTVTQDVLIATGATLAPGASPGVLNINGNLTLNSGSITNIEVGGTNALTPDFDQIIVDGTAFLNGTLNVSLLNGFSPDRTENFRILQATVVSGDFTTKNLAVHNGLPLFTTTAGATFYDLAGNALVVRNTNDSGPFSLRDRIATANATVGADQVLFRIGEGPATIAPTSPLPSITETIFIDATSQLGYAGSPLIEINGSGAGNSSVIGLQLAAGSSESLIQGLAINRFSGDGIRIDSSSNRVSFNFIGTNRAGTAASPNGGNGITIWDASNNIVGGPSNDARNILSGNTGAGVVIRGSSSSGNRVQGNYIGTRNNGLVAIPNSAGGVIILEAASANFIGTDGDGVSDAGEGNTISGNNSSGVTVYSNASGTRIAGNKIGTNPQGTAAVRNLWSGIRVYDGASGTIIGTDGDGTSDALEGNVISGNDGYGIWASDLSVTSLSIAGNLIGTSADGSSAIPNSNGILLSSVIGAVIGGALPQQANVISGNNGSGIWMYLSRSNSIINNTIGLNQLENAPLGNLTYGIFVDTYNFNNVVESNTISGNANGLFIFRSGSNTVTGNIVGLSGDGMTAIGNTGFGVGLQGGDCDFNRIGTDGDGINDASERNLIAGNGQYNVYANFAFDTTIAGNYIGLGTDGSTTFANTATVAGVFLLNTMRTWLGTNGSNDSNNASERNLISGSAGPGISIFGSDPDRPYRNDETVIAGNVIGLSVGGVARPNLGDGIRIAGQVVLTRIGTNSNGVHDDLERNIISGNNGSGISVVGSGVKNSVIAGNYIGTLPDGTTAAGNLNGILLSGGATNATIGGTTAAARNVISGNSSTGISLVDAGTSGNVVRGNYIGTDSTGAVGLGNGLVGIAINGASGNTVGGLTAGARNVISGQEFGISLTGAASSNSVVGNYIGLNAAGTAAISNHIGIQSTATAVNTIGGTAAGSRNVISGNSSYGVALVADDHIIQGNWIGLNAAGDAAIANGLAGVLINGNDDNLIGGTAAGAGNVISGNTAGDGVWITNGAQGNIVQGNRIGTNPAGTVAIPNTFGVNLNAGASNNMIGGSAAGARNIVSGNSASGVNLHNASNNTVQGNYIGTDAAGGLDLGNAGLGIRVEDSPSLTIGGSAAGAGNLVSGNDQGGIAIIGQSSTGVTVLGNQVGTNAVGTAARANGQFGIFVGDGDLIGISNTTAAKGVVIGGTTANTRNIISGNTGPGLWIGGSGGDDNIAIGNYVGLASSGNAAIPNTTHGIMVSNGAKRTRIGTDGNGQNDSSEGNVISGNSAAGILILGIGTEDTVIAGNYLGTDPTGTADLGNNTYGINIYNTSKVRIGTDGSSDNHNAFERNVISGNDDSGIYVALASNITVAGNIVGLKADGDGLLANQDMGIAVDAVTDMRIGTNGDNQYDGFERNIISGNRYGISLFSSSQLATSRVVIAGNYIGTDVSGTKARGNSSTAVGITGNTSEIRIGAVVDGVDEANERNIVSGNGGAGFAIAYASVSVVGNYVGTDVTGNVDLGNDLEGFRVVETNNTIIRKNVISGNNRSGIELGLTNNARIQGNIIGLNAAGNAKIGNLNRGIDVRGGLNNIVGTDGDGAGDASEGNTISGNGEVGVWVLQDSVGARIAGNRIGTNVLGTAALGNNTDGVNIQYSNQTVVGSNLDGISDSLEGNLISGNGSAGISILNEGRNVQIAGNIIGLDMAGSSALGNAGNGISIAGVLGDLVVGGTSVAARNLISNNASNGIYVGGSSAGAARILGNYIGTNANGMADRGNAAFGIMIDNSPSHAIGDSVVGAGNLISGNDQGGVAIIGQASTGVTVLGNKVGTNTSGAASLANNQFGIFVGDGDLIGFANTTAAKGVTIGGSTITRRNVISGNNGYGVWIGGSSASDNIVSGNYVGLNSSGDAAVANGLIGIFVDGANNNLIGGTSPGAGNTVSGNSGDGIVLSNMSISNAIRGNRIGADAIGNAMPNPVGIRVTFNSVSNTIADNEVRFSTSDNILIESPGNTLSRNASSEMGGLPIRLNPPTLRPGNVALTQVVSGNNPIILGDVNANGLTTYTVEIFSSPVLGQARRYIASANVTTNAMGFASFSIAPPSGQLNGLVHATLTGIGAGQTLPNTSPLSNGVLGTPAVILGLESQSPEGTPITLTAFSSTNPVVGYLWEVLKEGVPYAFQLRADGTQSDGGIQFTPDDEGNYTVSLRVTLEDGSQTLVGPFDVQVFNVAPTASFTYSPAEIAVGTPVTLTNTSSDPGQLDVLTTAWEVRSGSATGPVVFSTAASINPTATFTPSAGGFYYATLTVNDGDGGDRTLTREIAVAGLPTSSSIIVSEPIVVEGQTVRARAPESELNRSEQLAFQWSVTKNPSSGPSVSYPFTEPSRGVVEFIPDDNGTYTINLTIVAASGNVVVPPQQVIVGNVAPRIQITEIPTNLEVGLPINLGSSITDPGSADTQTVTWTVTRDDQPFSAGSGVSFSFTPNVPGVYSVVASISDDDGGVGSDRRVFQVIDRSGTPPRQPEEPSRVAPGLVSVAIVASTGPYIEGDQINFSLNINEPGSPAVTAYIWRARNASRVFASGTDATFAFTPSQGDNYIIEVSVTLADGRTGSASLGPLNVQGIAPAINSLRIIQPTVSPILEGTPVIVRVDAVDARESIGLDYRWALKRPGEANFTVLGGVEGAPADFRFVPEDDGSYEVRVRVTDSQNLSVQRNLLVTVVNANPVVVLESNFNAASSSVTFIAVATDPGIADTPDLRYAWSADGGLSYTTPSASNQYTSPVSLTSLRVRVTDGDGGSDEISYFVLAGSASNDVRTISNTDTAGAGANDDILYLALDGDDNISIAATVTQTVFIMGGNGNDIINASGVMVPIVLDGGEGNDILIGGSGDDVLTAGPGSNTLFGGNGNNRFVGGGNDTMIGGVDSDYYQVHFSTVVLNDAGGGGDTIDLTAAQAGVTLNLSSNTGTPQPVFAGSTLALNGSFETLIGSRYGDVLSTSTPGTTIEGGAGGDRLISTAVGTFLDGGDGDDVIDLVDAAGTVLGGAGNDKVQGTLQSTSTTDIATGSGDDIVEIQGGSTTQHSSVSIGLGDGNNQLVASRITGKIYANNGSSDGIDIFGSASGNSSLTASLSGSSNVDIFGSASPGVSAIHISGSTNIDIFGSASPTSNTINATISGSSNIDIFGSASPGASTVVVNGGSSNIDIFGSASPNSGALTASISGSSNVDIFGSASSGRVTTVTVSDGSNNIDIFGSASPTGSALSATISGSSNVDIFGSASPGGNAITINSGSSDIDIFGSASTGPTSVNVNSSQNIDIFGSASSGGGGLSAVINSSSHIDIFGSAATGRQTTVTVDNGSSNIDIFGSASPTGSNLTATIGGGSSNIDIFGSANTGGQTTVTVNGSSNIDIFGSASPTGSSLNTTINGSSNIDIFGSAASGGQTMVTVNSGSSNIDIFGSASPTGSNLSATINGSSSNIDIFGSAASGGQTTVTVNAGSSNIDIFGSASPTGSNLSATISGSTGNIDIFGSAATGGQTTVIVNGSSNIDIFGSASPTGSNLSATIGGSSNVDIFGSAASGGQTTVTVNNGSSNIDIFGSASPTGSDLSATISGSSNIDIFGSAATGRQTTVNVNSSSNIDIFGSAAPTGSGLSASIIGSSNVDIFGSAATGRQTTITVNSSSDIDIFGSASPTGSSLNAMVNGSTNIDIFGSANPGSITVSTSQDIDIFGSASTGTTINVNTSSDVDIYGGYGDVVTLDQTARTRVEGGIFGSASGPSRNGITVTVTGGSSDIGIFGTSANDRVYVGPSMNAGVDLRGGDDIVEIDGAQSFVAITDQGVDRVTIRSGFDLLVYMGAGADQVELLGGDLIRVIGDEGDDAFFVSGVSGVTVDAGNGNDDLFVVGGNGVNVRGDAGDDDIDIYGGVGLSVTGGSGADRLRFFGSLGAPLEPGKVYALLDGQSGNDILEVRPLLRVLDRVVPSIDSPHLFAPSWMTFPAWITEPTTTTLASSIALVGGSGEDALWLEGSQRLYGLGGEDADTINLQAGNSSEVDGGSGGDQIAVSAAGFDNRIFGERGADTIDAFAGIRLAVFGGEDNDTIRLHDGQDGFARGEAGEDHLEVRNGSRMVLAGEDGVDTLVLSGGTSGIAAGGSGDDSLEISGGVAGLLLGQSGNDHLKVSGGSQSILSGGDGDDLVAAIGRDADLYGDDGDDTYQLMAATSQTLSVSSLLRIRELIYVSSTNLESESRGVDTVDLDSFASRAVLDLSLQGLINDASVGLQTVITGQLGLILLGSIENAIGTAFDDVLIGNGEANRLEGRGGNDELRGLDGDDILAGGTGNDLLLGGGGNDVYIFETAAGVSLGNDVVIETASAGIDALDFRGLPIGLGSLNLNLATAQSLAGGLMQLTLQSSVGQSQPAEIEDVVGTEFNDALIGNDLDNRFEMLNGNNVVDGRAGSDIYTFFGIASGSTTITDAPSGAGRDTLDFAGFDFPMDLDLAMTAPQVLGPLSLTLTSSASIENVVGTSFNDRILGNALDNTIFGAGGRDVLDGRAGSDRLVADLPQIVLLDFDSAFRAERGDYDYNETERSAIMERVAAAYATFNWMFTRSEAQAAAWASDMGRNFIRLEFSKGRGGGVSGDAGEIDFRNIQRRIISEVNVNPLLPTVVDLLIKKFGPSYTLQQYSDMVVALTSTIAAHELAHTAGLRHGDAFGPIGSGVFASTDTSGVYPEYQGPRGASETVSHIIASPLSVGSTIEDATKRTFFGEREAIKMAFNEIGITRREQATGFNAHGQIGTAEDLGSLEPLTVPNLAPDSSFLRFGQSFNVSALAVIGDLRSQSIAGVEGTEFDFYRFTGKAGDIVNIELLANSIRPLRGDLFDSELRVYKADGTQIAFNDDDFEGTKDATILDLTLPEDGAYFVAVGRSEFPAILSGGGRYELLISRFSVGQGLPVPGDTIMGGPGNDDVVGGSGDDLLLISSAPQRSILGNGGRDQLRIVGSNIHLDTVAMNNVKGIEEMDLTGTGNNTLTTDAARVLLSDSGTLIVRGDVGDSVNKGTGWSFAGTETISSALFKVYTQGLATLKLPFIADTTLSSQSIAENSPLNTVVGSFSAFQVDSSSTFTYALASGAGDSDNAAFTISGNALRVNTNLDFETKASYTVRVRSTDQEGLFTEKAFVIGVLNRNELISVTVNGADTYLTPNQRSQVTSLVVVTESALSNPESAFSLTNIGLFTASSTPLGSSQILVTQTGTSTYVIRFGIGAGVVTRQGTGARGHSLADGNWILQIDPARISGKNQYGNQAVDRFFRMFGDSDGDGDVDGIDTVALRRAQVAATYNASLDWDGNGSVSAGVDINNFSSNLNKRRRIF